MALTDKHVQDVCCGMYWQTHKTCRYLTHESTTGGFGIKHLCLKLVQIEKDKIDDAVDKFLKDCKKNGQDPKQMGQALGDNCQGYLYLKFKKQGYNLDKKKK